jgi:hypothetical protein
MENKKFKKTYAELLATKNVGVIQESAFVKGYMMAIKETAAPDLLEALIEAYDEIKFLDKQVTMIFNVNTEKGKKSWENFSNRMIKIEKAINKAIK